MPPTDSYKALVASAVAVAMRQAAITQVQLAEATGIPQPTLNRRLHGHVSFTVDEIYRIATHLGVPVQDLLSGRTAA